MTATLASRSGPNAPLWLRFLRLLIWCFFNVAKLPWFRIKVENRPVLEGMGPVIIAPNHISFLDPPVLQTALRRHVIYMMTEVIYNAPIIKWMFRIWSAIPVPEDRPPAAAMKAALRTLRDGEPIVIFPEGKISRDGCLNEGQGGVGMLMAKCNVPVIPVAIIGTYEVLPRHKRWPRRHPVTVRFGEPIEPGNLSKDDVPAFVEKVMAAIHALGAPRR